MNKDNKKMDAVVGKLAWTPPKDAHQDRQGQWRWNAGYIDPYNNKLGGQFVKGSPRPPGVTVSPDRKKYRRLCQDYSDSGLSELERMFYSDKTPDQVKVQIWKLWDERGWGKIPMAEEDRDAFDLGTFRPIVIQKKEDKNDDV